MHKGSNPFTSTKNKLLKKPFINNQIRAKEVRVIDETGKQLGLFNLPEALKLARERNLDLIQVTEKVEPPICKIMEYGKFLYSLQKKEKEARHKMTGEIKGIRFGFNISSHDLETKINQAENFLKKGNKVRVEMVLRGREKALAEFAKGKIQSFLEGLGKLLPIKIERELKREPRGYTIIVTKQ